MNKQNFIVYVEVNRANPNGDINCNNAPRTDLDGYGIMTDVCIKRKLRDRLQAMGNDIYYQQQSRINDGMKSLNERAESVAKGKTVEEAMAIMKEKYIDNRLFGFMCTSDKITMNLTGAVSIGFSSSLEPVELEEFAITKSMNGKTTKNDKKANDTIGTKTVVHHGIYKICASLDGREADKYGVTNEDVEQLKEAFHTLFVGDASAARPAGSMEVMKCFWVEHDCLDGKMSDKKVYDSIQFDGKNFTYPTDIDGLKVTMVDGF